MSNNRKSYSETKLYSVYWCKPREIMLKSVEASQIETGVIESSMWPWIVCYYQHEMFLCSYQLTPCVTTFKGKSCPLPRPLCATWQWKGIMLQPGASCCGWGILEYHRSDLAGLPSATVPDEGVGDLQDSFKEKDQAGEDRLWCFRAALCCARTPIRVGRWTYGAFEASL